MPEIVYIYQTLYYNFTKQKLTIKAVREQEEETETWVFASEAIEDWVELIVPERTA